MDKEHADACIYMYSDLKSFQGLQVQSTDAAIRMLIGNKIDLPRTVELEAAQDFA